MKYEFEIKTGDQSGAGTDSNIFVVMYGEFGQSREYRLNGYISGNAFERNDKDRFSINDVDDIGRVYAIDLRSDNTYAGAAWLLSYIKINRADGEKGSKSNDVSVFHINQWINDTKKRNLEVSDWRNVAKIETEEVEFMTETFRVPARGKAVYRREEKTTTGFSYTNVKTKKTTTNFSTEMSAKSSLSATIPLAEALSATASSERFLKFAFSRGFENSQLTEMVKTENKELSETVELTLVNDTDENQEYKMTFNLIKINVITQSNAVVAMFSGNSKLYFAGASLIK